MPDSLFLVPLQMQLYYAILAIAISIFESGRAAGLAGVIIEGLTEWLQVSMFGTTIQYTSDASKPLMSMFAIIAVMLLAFSYLLSPLVNIRVVNWQKALGWFMFATVFFSQGPTLYQQTEEARRSLASDLYKTVLDNTEIPGLSEIGNGLGDDQIMGALPSDNISGLDVGMAYLLADRGEILAPTTKLPTKFNKVYFPARLDAEKFKSLNPSERSESISLGLQGCLRFITGHIVLCYGIVEQLVYLMLTIAAGLLFINMALVLPLSLFEYTEPMAGSVLDSWFKLFIFTIIASAFQAIVVGVVIMAAEAANPAMVLGTSFVGSFLMIGLLIRSFSAIGDSMNQVFATASQVTGGKIHSPSDLGGAALGATAGAALTVATAGAGAAVAAAAGGSMAQIAGSALSGSDKLFQGAAIGSMVLPDSSPLKESATGFYEGAMSNRMLGPLGGTLLRKKEVETGEAKEFTAGDAAGLEREATSTAMGLAIGHAISSAPPGGYTNPEAAIEAVRAALQAQGPLNARQEAHLEQRSHGIGQHVMSESQQADKTLHVNVSVSDNKRDNGKEAPTMATPNQTRGKN